MDIIWYGQACFKLKGKNAQVLIDPFSEEFIGLKLPKDLSCDLLINTHDHPDHNNFAAIPDSPIKITGPGAYEIKGIAVTGVSVYHDKKQGEERGRNTIYNIEIDGVNVVHLGDLGHELTESQLDELGPSDILLIPVGGVYTIDAKDASTVVSQIEPKIIIPMHYSLPGLKAELAPVENFLKEMGVENTAPLPKLSISRDKLPDEMEVVVLSKV